MKKIFFFLLVFFFTFSVKADTLKYFEVLNGKLSIPFDSKINYYSVYLVEGEENILANYKAVEDSYEVKNEEDSEKLVLEVTNNSEKEKYVFYKVKKEDDVVPVFKEEIKKEEKIKYLEFYVFIPCLVIILVLFKILVLRKTK